jgi:predicted RNA binding protein YcfA (HicA-like mRNA interferase family)
MGRKLRLVSGRQAVKKFERAGWTFVRQRGSHMMLTNPKYEWTLSVPNHKEIGPGLLSKLVKQAGLDAEQFNDL